MTNHSDQADLLCPSAQPDTPGGIVFGVITGSQERRRVGYLTEKQAVTDDLLKLAEPARPQQVFRFSAPCAGSGCMHFDGANCRLASRVASRMEPVVNALPPCGIRQTCRWFRQEGKAACLRCPQVVTEVHDASEEWLQVAQPEPR
jgi:hypothetical protein